MFNVLVFKIAWSHFTCAALIKKLKIRIQTDVPVIALLVSHLTQSAVFRVVP